METFSPQCASGNAFYILENEAREKPQRDQGALAEENAAQIQLAYLRIRSI